MNINTLLSFSGHGSVSRAASGDAGEQERA